jgi:hypothetical protein
MSQKGWWVPGAVPAALSPTSPPTSAPAVPPTNRPLWPLVLVVVGLTALAAIGAEILFLARLRRPEAAPQATTPVARTDTEEANRALIQTRVETETTRAELARLKSDVETARRETARTNTELVRAQFQGLVISASVQVAVRAQRQPPVPLRSVEARGEVRNEIPEPVTTAIGGLTASHLYQTHLNLGLLADAVEKDVYTPAQGKKVLDEINTLVDTVEMQLDRVAPTALKPEERKALERVLAITAQLRTQAKELREYWDSDDEVLAKQFQKARAEAWVGIKELLGITR